MPPERTRQATRPVTYFIQPVQGGYVKIGRSSESQLPSRFRDLQVGHPAILRIAGLLQGDREREMHGLFSDRRVGGEWFIPTEAMRQYAPDLIVDQADLDLDDACSAAYKRGWEDALAHAATVIPDDLAAWLQRALSDIAADPVLVPVAREKFAPRSHSQSQGERDAA